MKIGLQTYGTVGDVRPFMALAGQLAEAGHSVTVAYTSFDNKDYSALSKPLKIKLMRVGKDFDPDLDTVYQMLMNCKNNLQRTGLACGLCFEPYVDEMYAASEVLCKENDLVIGHSLVHTLMTAAEKYNRPRATIVMCHRLVEAKYMPPPEAPYLGPWVNYLFWRLSDKFALKWLPSIDRIRKQQNLPPVKKIYERLCGPDLILMPLSAALIPREQGWPDALHLCGLFETPSHREHLSIPDKLQSFLEAGAPPVFFTFGSLGHCDMVGAKKLFIESAQKSNMRAILQADWEDHELLKNEPNILQIKEVPHYAVFPKCALVVHHGGAGTTQTACMSGCPSIIIDHAFDQKIWGEILEKAGIAGKTMHRNHITSDKLANQIKQVLSNKVMGDKAMGIAKQMQLEDGLKKAVDLIENKFGYLDLMVKNLQVSVKDEMEATEKMQPEPSH